jgi:PfaD family protein
MHVGWWSAGGGEAVSGRREWMKAVLDIRKPLYVVEKDGLHAVAEGGSVELGAQESKDPAAMRVIAYVPAFRAENLGDAGFCRDHKVRYPYYAGSMAHGIGSAELVESLAGEGMLAFFGSAGLPLGKIEAAIDRLQALGDKPYGFNLIHTPGHRIESDVVELYIRKGVRLVEASAFLDITLPLVRYRVHGIHKDAAGRTITPNRIIAKVSRVEIASKFFAPPPEKMLRELAESGHITMDQAELAKKIPLAQDVTAEADSAGHTDNRPAVTLVPTMLALRDRMQGEHNYQQRLRVGAAAGISTPASAAAAFSMGAAYIVTGTVNQACIESGTSDAVREMLSATGQADVAMAPSADMFEMGVKVQVLKRGTMFAMKAAKLYALYSTFAKIEDIPASEKAILEKNFFRTTIDEIWSQTRGYFLDRDPEQAVRAEKDPKYKMALIFRWYLGKSSHWAKAGDMDRRIDYQVWCGPAMGAFNEWTAGTFLGERANRKVATVALNLLHGAAVVMRLSILRSQRVDFDMSPAPIEERLLREYIGG